MEVTNLPELSVVEPQSVPSRISVVLVEEAKVGGTQCSGCPRVDQDLRLLAGVAKPASMTVCEDSYISPCAEGTLSSSDLAGRLVPVVPAGIPFPVGPVGHIGPCGTLSPSDSESVGLDGPYGTLSLSAHVAVGPVGPYGTLSPFNPDSVGPCGTLSTPDTGAIGPVGSGGTLFLSDPAGILLPSVPAGILFPVGPIGPIGPCGKLSPSDSDSAIMVDPGGVLPLSDLAGVMVPDALAESAFLVGPAMTLGVLPPSDKDSVDPVVPTRMLSSSVIEYAGPLGPVGTLLPGEDGSGRCPIVPTGGLLSVVAVPLPAVRYQAITQLPVKVGDCGDVVNQNITVHGGWSVPEVAVTPAVVAMVGCDVMPLGNDTPLDCVDKCAEWDIRD